MKYEIISHNFVYTFLPHLSKRYQVLHHAFVYNFSTIIFLIDNQHLYTIQNIIIDYNQD